MMEFMQIGVGLRLTSGLLVFKFFVYYYFYIILDLKKITLVASLSVAPAVFSFSKVNNRH